MRVVLILTTHIVEKAIHRSAKSIKVQVPEGTRPIAHLPDNDPRKRKGSKHQHSSLISVYIKPNKKQLPGIPVHEPFNQTKSTNFPVELAADGKIRASTRPVPRPAQCKSSSPVSPPPKSLAHESLNRMNAPVELPAGRVSLVSAPPVPQPFHRKSSSAPLPRTPKIHAHESFKQTNPLMESSADERSPVSKRPVPQPFHRKSSSAPLPRTPKVPAHESSKQKTLPAEPPAEKGSPVFIPPVPRPFHRKSSSAPVLGPPPQPQSPNTRRKMPLLVPPKDGASQKSNSRGSSMRSANIPLYYCPSNQHYDAERENPLPLKVGTTLFPPFQPTSIKRFVVQHKIQRYALTAEYRLSIPFPRP